MKGQNGICGVEIYIDHENHGLKAIGNVSISRLNSYKSRKLHELSTDEDKRQCMLCSDYVDEMLCLILPLQRTCVKKKTIKNNL